MKEYNSYVMMVGKGMAGVKPEKEKKVYVYPKRIDKRTKKYGNARRSKNWQGTTYKSKYDEKKKTEQQEPSLS
jgi:hypothetical protein